MTPVLLSLGSNIGDRAAALSAAIDALPPVVIVDRVSSFQETEPMYVADQPAYLNAALLGRTALEPEALLDALKGLERSLGREPSRRYGPRSIDIDILILGDRVVSTPRLTIPHPRMAERAFVLVPAVEIAPDTRHPTLGRTIAELAAEVPGRETVRPYRPTSVPGPHLTILIGDFRAEVRDDGTARETIGVDVRLVVPHPGEGFADYIGAVVSYEDAVTALRELNREGFPRDAETVAWWLATRLGGSAALLSIIVRIRDKIGENTYELKRPTPI